MKKWEGLSTPKAMKRTAAIKKKKKEVKSVTDEQFDRGEVDIGALY